MIPVPDLLPASLAGLLRGQPLSTAKVAFAWRCAAGEAMARSADIALDADGVLAVRAPDAHWRREIARSTPVLLSRLQALLGPEVVRCLDVA